MYITLGCYTGLQSFILDKKVILYRRGAAHCAYILQVPMIGANVSSCKCSSLFDDKPEFNLYPCKTIIISS